MAEITLPYTIATGQQRSAAKIQANDEALRDGANTVEDGNIGTPLTPDVLGDGVVVAAGLNETGIVRRGKSIIATEEARTNTAYGLLATPDQVLNVVLPTDGLICVAYQALWKESVADAGRAAIFLDGTQVQVQAATAPVAQEAIGQGSVYKPLATRSEGLVGSAGGTHASDVTTGQIISSGQATVAGAWPTGTGGGPCYIFAAADTYTVSIQFKATSGSVTAKERKLWVWTLGF